MKKKYTYEDYLEAIEKDPDFKGEYSAIKETYAMRFSVQDKMVRAGKMDAPLYLK